MQYRQVQRLSSTDAAYIAGIIDGEGTITLTRNSRNEHRRLVVSVSSTEYELLSYLLARVGAGKITHKTILKSNHSAAYTYQLSNRQALSLLNHISPFLKTYKRERAQLALRHYLSVTPRNGKYSKDMLVAKKRFDEEFFSYSTPNAKRLS